MYVGSYAICVLNWNWWLTQDHFLIRHWSQRTHRCSARVVGLEACAPVPPNAVMSGYTVTGVPIYLGRGGKDLGFYAAGSNSLMTYVEIYTGNVMLLVLIWRWLFIEAWEKLEIKDCVAWSNFWYLQMWWTLTLLGIPIYLCGHRNIGRHLGYYIAEPNFFWILDWECDVSLLN